MRGSTGSGIQQHERAHPIILPVVSRPGGQGPERRRRGPSPAQTCSSWPGTATVPGSGPGALGPADRFVVDHAPCPVLLVWPEDPPGTATIPRPPPSPPPRPLGPTLPTGSGLKMLMRSRRPRLLMRDWAHVRRPDPAPPVAGPRSAAGRAATSWPSGIRSCTGWSPRSGPARPAVGGDPFRGAGPLGALPAAGKPSGGRHPRAPDRRARWRGHAGTGAGAARRHARARSGLSGSKAASLRDLAAKVLDGTVVLDPPGLRAESDAEVVARLTTVQGIGKWTAEMFLMFQLRRLDVWPTGDLGVRKGSGWPGRSRRRRRSSSSRSATRTGRTVRSWPGTAGGRPRIYGGTADSALTR